MKKTFLWGLGPFITLWSTQALSTLGSSMTSFALVIWTYQQQGSALTTALLSVCSYAPYVVLSIFAGVVSDRWNKKYTMLACDTLAAVTTCTVWILLATGNLKIWHLYLLNAVNGMMNSVQQPASEVAVSLLAPKEQYQRIGGLQAFSRSLVTILTPVLAPAVLTLAGMNAILLFDLMSFAIAFLTLAVCISIPHTSQGEKTTPEPFWQAAKKGFHFLQENRGILDLILFLAGINLIASVYEAALPAMLLSRTGGSSTALGMVSTFTGIATFVGSIAASLLPAPKSRTRVICNTLLFSMCTENFFLAFGKSVPIWCLGAVLGWLTVPFMNTNLDALLRTHIPVAMQGRVYSIRNALQFFTIPLGYLMGGMAVDWIFEPLMQVQSKGSLLVQLFGQGKGTGAALLYSILAICGIGTCLVFRRDKHIWLLEQKSSSK